MKKHFSKLFLIFGCLFTAMAFGLLLTHIYWGDRFFPATRYFSSPQSHFYAPNATEFSIALAGDTGAENYVLERIIDDVRHSDKNYVFMLHLGDFVTKKTRTGLSWLLYEIRPRLKGLPFYSTPGNHDVELHYAVDKSHYRSLLGSPYYWFGYGKVLFIAVDSSGKQIEDEQFEWLENTLAHIRPMFTHCVIYSHKPPKDIRPDFKKNHRLKDESVAKLARIVRKYNRKIDMMIFGHVHYFATDTFEGVPIYTIPESGQGARGDIKKYGYASISFDAHGVKSVESHYIDFRGPTREYFEYGMARRVFGYALRNVVSLFLMLAAACFITYGILRVKSS